MPRIRKKTSKRVTTHKRARIQHKAAEGRKKKKKEAKKSTQWKSKKKKDPGIPNEFPYKDQILAEVAETRRQAEEAKRRRKEERKAAREGADAPAAQQEQDGADDGEESPSSRRAPDDAPLLLSPDLPNLRAVLDKADVVLHVLDARDPLSFRLAHLEEAVSAATKAELVFVLNKIDLVPRENAAAWARHLRTLRPTFLFHAASAPGPGHGHDAIAKGKEKETRADAAGVNALLGYLAQRAEKVEHAPLQVAVVGLTNTGKSAVINALARRAAVPVYVPTPSADARSTTTTRAVEVLVETLTHKKVTLIDTPGVSFEPNGSDEDEGVLKIRDLLLRSRGRIDKLKDPVPAVAHIVARATARDLMVHYALPAFAAGDTAAFLAGVARARGTTARMGAPDALGAARGVLRDWAAGRLPRCADAPPDAGAGAGAGTEAEAGAGDEKVLAGVRTRAEMRRGAGIVMIVSGEVERRRVELEKAFEREGEESDTEGDNDDDGEDEDSADEEDSAAEDAEEDAAEEDAEADTDGDIQPAAPPSRKRKRGEKTAEPRTTKKVAFAAGTLDHHERKQARRLPAKAAAKPAKAAARPARPAKAAKKQQAAADSEAYDFGQFFN